MRLVGRFVLLRWHCVRRQWSPQPLRLLQDLTTARGGTLTRIMPNGRQTARQTVRRPDGRVNGGNIGLLVVGEATYRSVDEGRPG